MRRNSMFLSLLATSVLMAAATDLARAQESACTPAPRTGCLQSDQVELRVARDPERLSWRWHGQAPGTAADLALCLYDGETTGQTDVAAPTPETDSLILGVSVSAIESDDQGLSARVEAEVSWLERLFGGGGEIGLAALDSVEGSRIISQLQGGDDLCLGRSVSIAYDNGPPFPESGNGVMDASKGKRLLDDLAAEYNGEQGGEPLSMMRWISSIAATQLQNRVVSSPPSELDLEAVFGALHISGWFGGIWFVRDGFQRPAPEAVNLAAAEAAARLYVEGRDAALEASDEEIFAYLTHQETTQGPAGDSVGGTGLASLVDSYGYNTGYSLQVNEETVDGKVTPAPPEKLACPGSHPQLVARNDPHADAPLLGCTYSPSYMASLAGLRPYRDAYVTAFPERAAELKAIQDRAEARGRTVWSYMLGNVIKADQAVREALWDVDNAFLEVVHAAGLLNMGAQVNRDAELGRRAALGSSGVLKGWLASYGLGLGAPEPRVLPTWDLGTTPVMTLEE